MIEKGFLNFQKFGVICIVVVYLLILAGGIVRTTGSGMGCPDWPTCFGRIIPPTKESELPPDYQEKYISHGSTKFNPVKTWIEYVNRLLGAITGLLFIVLFFASFIYKKTDKAIIRLCGLALIVVIIEGIIGKYVVAMNLEGRTVTIHFWGSIIVILLLIYIISRTRKKNLIVEKIGEAGTLRAIVLFLMALTVVQVILGTQVRQEIEQISLQLDYTQRETWIDRLSTVFYIHRSFSILILAVHLFFFYNVRNLVGGGNILNRMTVLLMILLIVEILAGITMNYFNVPLFVQPLHMLLGSILMGVQFFIFIIISFSISAKGKYIPVNS